MYSYVDFSSGHIFILREMTLFCLWYTKINTSFAERKTNVTEMRAGYAAGTRVVWEAPAAGHIYSVQVGKAALRAGEAWLMGRWNLQ